jgi:drug/metabolite transporter (DMT)-like permease
VRLSQRRPRYAVAERLADPLCAGVTSSQRTPLEGTDLALYAATVFVWGTSWIAIRGQLGVVAPEVSVLWRFMLAAAVMAAFALWRGERLRGYPAALHLRFAGTGVLLFCANFVLFYYGGLTVPSGLLAVVFSLASVMNLLLAAVLLGNRIEPRVASGGIVGFVGIGLLFWPQIASVGFDRAAFAGLGLCVAGTLSFCLGNMLTSTIQRRGVPVMASTAWGMIYGVVALLTLCLVLGHAFIIEPTWRYLSSLAYLATGASVVAFGCYLTLLSRIGAARAAYATVLFPIVALAISTAVEGYRWTLPAVAGAALALLGNLLVLRR